MANLAGEPNGADIIPGLEGLNLNEEINERRGSKDLPAKLCDVRQFPVWSLRMRLHFEAIAVWDIVDGTRQSSAADLVIEVRQYNKNKSRAHSDLLRCLGDRFQNLAATYLTVHELWAALNDLF